jgi:hypothetical protein
MKKKRSVLYVLGFGVVEMSDRLVMTIMKINLPAVLNAAVLEISKNQLIKDADVM